MSGRVILVGAGPGDPGLMTIRAVEAIGEADVILHDRLIPATALTFAHPGAELIDVGKTGGGEQVPQAQTERLMLEHARAGRVVVRLKGGDPFVFGRGGEEALLCHELGIPFEVVPGVTAGIAAPALAGIPVTQRGMASAVAFVTARGAGDEQADWDALAKFPGTLVFYMGVGALEAVAQRLIGAGRGPDEPAAIVERGTLPGQFVVTATLDSIAERGEQLGVRSPAVTIVGPVVELSEQLGVVEDGPLANTSVVVTRTPHQASEIGRRLRDLGARVIDAPAIAIESLQASVPDLQPFDLLVLTSPNGVRFFFEQLRESGRDSRALAGLRIAVVGPGTAAALREHGLEPDIVPERAIGEGLVAALAGVEVRRALVARAQDARDVVVDALRQAGADVRVLALYRTRAAELDEHLREPVLSADWALFASASAARHFVAAVGGAAVIAASGLRTATIGPQTSAALREAGVEPAVEAATHTPDGLIDALCDQVRT
ncbi:MAG TPA: uroporphyrinogen-III C-methyltransferase [Baekduia sp.]|nr:uroporphyrinogen-III C-methyltransferase [Baekduia sp.]